VNILNILDPYFMLNEAKDHIINKLDLPPEEKEEIIQFFRTHSALESKVDWQDKQSLTSKFFKRFMNQYEADQLGKKSVKIERNDSEFIILETSNPNLIAYVPLTYRASVFLASPEEKTNNIQGDWCTAYPSSNEYWFSYTGRGITFIYWVLPDSKFATAYNERTRTENFTERDSPIGEANLITELGISKEEFDNLCQQTKPYHEQIMKDNNKPQWVIFKEFERNNEGQIVKLLSTTKKYFINMKNYNPTGAPSLITTRDGKITDFEYNTKEDRMFHRDGAPALLLYDPRTGTTREAWCQYGKVHREDGPANIIYYDYEEKSVKSEEWFRNSEPFRTGDLPTKQTYHEDGTLKSQEWSSKDDRYHRENGPARIFYNEAGIVSQEIWNKQGRIHREGGPANTLYNEEGGLYQEEWYQDDDLYRVHREDGPAVVQYNKQGGTVERESWFEDGSELRSVRYRPDGSKINEEWYYGNRLHRKDGPASITYNRDGSIESEEWYNYGNEREPPAWYSSSPELATVDPIPNVKDNP